MSNTEPPSLSLHGPGLRLLLTTDRDGDCLVEITQLEPAPGPWRLELDWQPVDRRGLSLGFTNRLYQTPLTFSRQFSEAPQAFVRLPENISFQLARQCYFRIVR